MKFNHLVLFLALISVGCQSEPKTASSHSENTSKENKEVFEDVLQIHLNAVSNKDLTTLKNTLHPEGKMFLVLPNRKITSTAQEFLALHEEWFKDKTWTFETKILESHIGEKFGIAIIETMYREPDRNGKPYFNKMYVTYGLEKVNGQWYVFKDHASSIEKS